MQKVFQVKTRAQISSHTSAKQDQSQPSTQNISSSATKFQQSKLFQQKDNQTPSFLSNINRRKNSKIRNQMKSQQLNDYDYEGAEEEKVNLQDLNQWESAKFFGNSKRFSLSTTHLSNTQMKLLSNFKENDQDEQNQINNQKQNDEAQNDEEFDLMKRKGKFLLSKQPQPSETFEQMRRSRNLKLMNQVIINKIEKKQDNQNSAMDVFSSFKNLTSLFRSFKTIINYQDIYEQLKQHQYKPEDKFINLEAEFSQDLKRQQQNFREIVENQLNLIKDEGIEIKNKKQQIYNIRLHSCSLQEQIQVLYLKLDKIKQYQNKIINKHRKGMDLKGNDYEKMKEMENKEIQQILYQIETIKSELYNVSHIIKEEENQVRRLNEKSETTKQELKHFLFLILKKDDIQITESLVSILKLLLQIKSHVGSNDLPHFLDHQSKTFILEKAQLEMQIDDIKKQIKQIIIGTSQQNDVLTPKSSNGARNFHSKKLKQVQEYFAHIKNEKMVIRDENLERTFQKQTSSSNNRKSENVVVPSQILNYQAKITELDNQIVQLEKAEIERLKQLCIQRQFGQVQCSRVVKIIQAEFGVKQLSTRIQQVFQDNINAIQSDMITKPEPITNNLNKPNENINYYKERQMKILKNIETTPGINYHYDPIDNFLKQGNDFFLNQEN